MPAKSVVWDKEQKELPFDFFQEEKVERRKVALRLKFARQEAVMLNGVSLTQADIALQLGTTRQRIAAIESGLVSPTYDELTKFLRLCGKGVEVAESYTL